MNQTEFESKLKEKDLLFKQEEGKRLAVERESYEIKKQAKLALEQAEALKAETEASLITASQQMQIAHSISMGIWAFSMMGRAFMSRKISAARVVHREQQHCLLMQQFIDGLAKKDGTAIGAAIEKAKAVIDTIKKDGEQSRLAAAEASLGYGITDFTLYFDRVTSEKLEDGK